MFAVDSGPIVALLDRRDEFHRWARDAWSSAAPPLLTCEPVLAEACYLVSGLDHGPERVLQLVQRGALKLSFRLDAEVEQVQRLMSRFASVPMSLADACLVRMTELDARITVMTLDSDFRVYRRNNRQVIPQLSPR